MPRSPINRSAKSASPIATTKYPHHTEDHELLDCKFPCVQKCLVRDFGHCLELVSLQVKPRHQNKGVGSHVLKMLQGYGRPIWVTPDGHLASDKRKSLVKFYSRAGFKVQPDNTMLWNPNEKSAAHKEA